MLIRNIFLIALLGLFILQSCSKKDPVAPDLPPVYHQDGDVTKVMYNNPNGGVNIVILGDGFTKKDLKEHGKYDALVKETTDYLFSVEPFKQYKSYFNIYQVYAESKVSGAANTYTPNRTKFDTYFGTINDRLLVTGNYDTCYSYAVKAIPYRQIALLVVIANDERYGGTGGGIATISANEWAKYVLVHEAGHSFAGLADEYVEEPIADNYSLDRIPYLPNIDNTSDLAKIKWAHLLEHKGYGPQLGAFEGAYYREHGIYRPEQTSIMKETNYPRFNAPSREAIVRTIDARLGIPFDLESFLKDDAKNFTPISAISGFHVPVLQHDFIDSKQRAMELYKLRQGVAQIHE
jgi:hypothetical protein